MKLIHQVPVLSHNEELLPKQPGAEVIQKALYSGYFK
jgi:hypothetical protein